MRSKKFVVLYAVAIFLIVFLITFNCVCSVSYIEVYFETDGTQVAAADAVRAELEDRYLRKNFLFFDEAGVKELVSEQSGGYFEVTSVEKSFPNTVTVRVREKYESYAFEKDGKYYVIGDDGTVLAVNQENKSDISDGRNIEIVGFAFPSAAVGEQFAVSAGYEEAYAALQTMFGVISDLGLRGNVLRIEYDGFFELPDPADWFPQFIIDCKEGVQIVIPDPQIDAQRKAQVAFDAYIRLGEQVGDIGRTEGRIEIREGADGAPTAVYTPSESPARTEVSGA